MLVSVRHTSEELTRKQASMGGGYRLKLVANRKVAKLSVNSDEGSVCSFLGTGGIDSLLKRSGPSGCKGALMF